MFYVAVFLLIITPLFQLELERQKREESDLKRELNQKNSQIEDLKMELKNKVG